MWDRSLASGRASSGRTRAAAASTLLLLVLLGSAVLAEPPASPDPARPPRDEGAEQRLVAEAFEGTAEWVTAWSAEGAWFTPAPRDGQDFASRVLAGDVVIVRPKDPRWEAVLTRWAALLRIEREGLTEARGATGPDAAAPGWVGSAIRDVRAVAGSFRALAEEVEASEALLMVDPRALAGIPAVGRVGWRAGRTFAAARDRARLERAAGEALGMECGTLGRKAQGSIRGFLGTLPGDAPCFIVLGEE